jgi:hypothetical protein
MKYKNYSALLKTKFSKKEKEVFVDKQYLIIITLPFKYHNNRKVNALPKKYKELQISICYSKNATKNSFFHCFFRPEDFIFSQWKDIMKNHTPILIELFKDIEAIKAAKK